MRKSRISTGIIGLGKIGLLYDLNTKKTLTYSKALTKNKLFKLDFACDPNKQKLKIFKKTYGTNCFENLKDAFKIYKSDLIIIEVQIGTYLGEDDIVRLEDDFARV